MRGDLVRSDVSESNQSPGPGPDFVPKPLHNRNGGRLKQALDLFSTVAINRR